MTMRARVAVIDRELCTNVKCGYQCEKVCPINRSGEDCISVEENGVFPVINENTCISCMLCVKKCDKIGFHAISIVNLPKELDENPIHRFGINEFALFRLPIPKQGSVVGLIGQNGVGKSTVMNILSGNLKPNNGLPGKAVEWKDIISRFHGSEIQEYLENLEHKKLKIAYKPQHVDLIPKIWKGNVKDLLLKENEPIENIVESLSLQEILNKDIASLSGGELQMTAIAATVLKDSDFVFFDEPSSYLDVKQRLIVAKEIRKLAEKKYVMIIEHDLAVLDYLSDSVHILYGSPSVFGVVSNPYGVRIGINTYLEGYIREENMRFREKPIKFSQTAAQSRKNRKFMDFAGFEKNFGDFEMATEKGTLFKGEIVGVLGPNGIGKTTFIRMLSGELKPDKGKAIKDLRISVKPQRLVVGKDEEALTVSGYLDKHVGSRMYETEFKKKLGNLRVERIMDKKIRNLSGGELQAVFILAALGKEHDILLLDEPSAFLDVEQRLNMAKMIRSHTEELEIPAFVIDHDLQVIDSISDRIMVFEGKGGVKGYGKSPTSIEKGMNSFLKGLNITFRKDPQTFRARANKPDSQKDREQKLAGKYYYC
jgi:ATP-binding cassette subfamily E protein 1